MDIALHTAERLDGLRRAYLRPLMAVTALRSLYLNRASRLFLSFLVGGLVSLFLSASFPLWVLAIGPIFFGLPHLIASFRYSADSSQNRSFFVTAAIFLSTLVCLYRLAQMQRWITPSGTNAPEMLAMAALFTVMLLTGRSRPRLLSVIAILFPLVFFSYRYPLPTLGALILAHNLVAFLYWYRAAHSASDKSVVGMSLLLFLIANVFIFLGSFDGLLLHFLPEGESVSLGMRIWETGYQVFPASTSYQWWSRGAVAYAFGQSVHYSIWLRAIPELALKNPTPSSFRQSLNFLKQDLGPRLARFSMYSVVALSSVWVLYEISWARIVYLCMAAFHGYAEFVGLCLKGREA